MIGTNWTHAHVFTLPASAKHVFSALTNSGELEQWFAEHVEIEPREGGAFRSWGRQTYGDAAGGLIRVFDPARTLSFDWIFDGVPSRVTWALGPDPGGDTGKTQLALTHDFDRSSGIAYEKELVDDLWRLIMGNLDAHLRGGSGVVRPDFTNPESEIRLSIVIDAPRERVFRALIEPDALKRWVGGQNPIVEPRVGGRYQIDMRYEVKGKPVVGGPTRILEIVPDQRIVTDWSDWRGDHTRQPTRLTWILEDVLPQGRDSSPDGASRTRVTLIHDGFARTADLGDYPFGWGWWLDQLKAEVLSGSDTVKGST